MIQYFAFFAFSLRYLREIKKPYILVNPIKGVSSLYLAGQRSAKVINNRSSCLILCNFTGVMRTCLR